MLRRVFCFGLASACRVFSRPSHVKLLIHRRQQYDHLVLILKTSFESCTTRLELHETSSDVYTPELAQSSLHGYLYERTVHEAGVNALGNATTSSLVVVHTDTTVQCGVQGKARQRPVILGGNMAWSTAIGTTCKKSYVIQTHQ